jgi:hypothetical protein
MMALLDEAESFFISHIRQGLRILLFLFGNSYSCTVPVLTTDVTDILTDMPGRSVATPTSHACHGSTQQYCTTVHCMGPLQAFSPPLPLGRLPAAGSHTRRRCGMALSAMQRPSTSGGRMMAGDDGSGGGFAPPEFDERPRTADYGPMPGGSFGSADTSDYRRRLDEFRQMSAPNIGIPFEAGGGSSRLSQADFLRFSRPSKLTGMRDKLKLETMSRAYGIPRAPSRRRQLSPVKKRRTAMSNGSESALVIAAPAASVLSPAHKRLSRLQPRPGSRSSRTLSK